VFSLVLDYFNHKVKPYCVIDTHAGAGIYALDSQFAQKNMEFDTGISRLLASSQSSIFPDSLTKFCSIVQSFNTSGELKYYPGSPKIADQFLRVKDKLYLFELHPNDYQTLQSNFNQQKNIHIHQKDGFQGLKGCLPPATKRGVIIIDPPYEEKKDYERVVTAIEDSLKRFATGCYMIWYPLLQRPEPAHMVSALHNLKFANWLNVEMNVCRPSNDGMGMFGSGLYIINPPWTLPETLEQSLPHLKQVLAHDDSAHYKLDFNIA
jgi:23S rRNA (adenine2030-N6)-methyltransferase